MTRVNHEQRSQSKKKKVLTRGLFVGDDPPMINDVTSKLHEQHALL